jgi:hypothetical protein
MKKTTLTLTAIAIAIAVATAAGTLLVHAASMEYKAVADWVKLPGPGVGGNQIRPDQWQTGVVMSPHGVAVNEHGDLFISEFNVFGRVHRFDRQ